jgi:hypothetical protein
VPCPTASARKWPCPLCDAPTTVTAKALAKHVKEAHHKAVVYRCHYCDAYSDSSLMRVTGHAATCKKQLPPDTVAQQPDHQAAPRFPCPHAGCDKGPFTTKQGLGVHINAAHKVERDAASVPTQSRLWTDDEVTLLAIEMRKLPSAIQANRMAAARELAENTAFAGRRTVDALRQMVNGERFKTASAALETGGGEQQSDTQAPTTHQVTRMTRAKRCLEELATEPTTSSAPYEAVPALSTTGTQEIEQQSPPAETDTQATLRLTIEGLLDEATENATLRAANVYVAAALRSKDPDAGWDAFVEQVKTRRHAEHPRRARQPAGEQPGGRVARRRTYASGGDRRTRFAEHQNAWRANPRIVLAAERATAPGGCS